MPTDKPNDTATFPEYQWQGEPHRNNDRAEREDRLPSVICNQRPLCEIVADFLKLAKKANTPPRIFQQGTVLTRVRSFDEDVFMESMNIDSFRGFVDRSATFLYKYFKDGNVRFSVKWPPMDLVKDILSLPGWPED